jgi:hypothetical protein
MRLDLAMSYDILDVKSYISKRRDISTRLRSVTDWKMVILGVHVEVFKFVISFSITTNTRVFTSSCEVRDYHVEDATYSFLGYDAV